MTRASAWTVHLSTLLVGASGLVYGWMRYLCTPADEFAVVNHPAQPGWHAAHVLTAPLLVFATGLLWRDHVWKRVRTGFAAARTTGVPLFLLFFPMALSGAVIQVAEATVLRSAAILVHATTGTLWCLVYLLHLVRQTRRGKTGPSPVSTDSSSRVA